MTGPLGCGAMTERSVFLEALEKEDRAARAAYLDAACAGRPALRKRIEELLQSHEEADTFLDVPAVEQMAAPERALAFLAPACEPGALGRLDHYEVLEVVGRGGTGVVLKALDTKLKRIVAIKALAARLAASAPARERFVREAQAVAAVSDDHVVAIHAVSDDGPVPYLVMEYISGITLEERVKQGEPLDLKETLRVGMQVAQGLAAAHAQGVVHRDIKPGNVLLENGVQRVKITDFGLARYDDGSPTATGLLAGTPLYMSPEQAAGEPSDHRTDLFSLGSVLYTLCAGRPPFRADTTPEVLKQVREDVPPPLGEIKPDVPSWLGELIGKLHAKKTCDRIGSAREVAELLSAQLARLQQPLLPAPPATAGVKAPGLESDVPRRSVAPRSGPKRLMVACLGALLLALAALVAYKQWQPQDPDDPHDEAHPSGPLELRRQDIPPNLLTLAGGGDPSQAPPELAAVLGDGQFLFPRIGQTAWMEQSPNGKVLAVPLDEDVVLFEIGTGRQLRISKGPGGRVVWVTFSRDSQLLAASTWYEGKGGSVRVWDVATNKALFTNQIPGLKVSGAAAFSANGKRLLTEGDKRIHVWDARSGQEVRPALMVPGGIAAMCLTPDGRRVAVANWHGSRVNLFDWREDDLAEVNTDLRHPWPVSTVAYSPDGKFLASGDLTGFKLWNAQSLVEKYATKTEASQLAFAPDSRTLYAATMNETPKRAHTLTRWDVVTQKELPALSVLVSVEPVRAFHCLSRDGKTLFVAQQHHATRVKQIDTAAGKELFPLQGHTAPLNAVAVSPDGRLVASAGDDWVVKLWDLATATVRYSLRAHTGAVSGLAFSRNGKLLASGSRDGTIALWDAKSGAEIRALHGHSRSFARIQFSPDGRTLAAGSEGGSVKTWQVPSGKEGNPLPGHTGGVHCVAFSPDGKLLASGGADKAVCVHDLAEGQFRKLTAPSAVNEVAFSPDGHILASAGESPGAVRFWDLETGHETILDGHTGHVSGLAFSPSAPLLATCGEDGTVRLWNYAREGDALVSTIGPGPFGGAVRSVAFTPDGCYLTTANANGTVYVLRIEDVR